MLFLPNVTATVAVGLVFNMVFDFNSGLINGMLKDLGLTPQPWLNSTGLSKIPVMVLNIWRVTPWYMLILLSGLQAINPELYQAATVDGASPVQKLFYITIPSLAPILFFCFLTETIDSFRIFTEPYIMTGGGPGSSSLSIVLYLYESGFRVQAGLRVHHRLRPHLDSADHLGGAGLLPAQAGQWSGGGRRVTALAATRERRPGLASSPAVCWSMPR